MHRINRMDSKILLANEPLMLASHLWDCQFLMNNNIHIVQEKDGDFFKHFIIKVQL